MCIYTYICDSISPEQQSLYKSIYHEFYCASRPVTNPFWTSSLPLAWRQKFLLSDYLFTMERKRQLPGSCLMNQRADCSLAYTHFSYVLILTLEFGRSMLTYRSAAWGQSILFSLSLNLALVSVLQELLYLPTLRKSVLDDS